MDNNFSDILNIFKRLDEASYVNGQVEDPQSLRWKQTNMSYEEALAKFGKDNVKQDGKNRLGQDIVMVLTPLGEDTMTGAEKHPEGPKFTGYWKGTDAGTPGNKMVGAAEGVEQECKEPMALADKLRARWEETKKSKGLQEYGAVAATGTIPPAGTGGLPSAGSTATPATATNPAAAAAKQKADVQKSLQGIPGIDANKAATDLSNPTNANQAGGLDVAIANALKDPATAQKAKDLLAAGMKTGQQTGTV